MSDARICGTAALELVRKGGRRALAAISVGVGQVIAIALQAVMTIKGVLVVVIEASKQPKKA
jgi:hypothetical protein